MRKGKEEKDERRGCEESAPTKTPTQKSNSCTLAEEDAPSTRAEFGDLWRGFRLLARREPDPFGRVQGRPRCGLS